MRKTRGNLIKISFLFLMFTIFLVGCSDQAINQETKTSEAGIDDSLSDLIEDENGNIPVSQEDDLEVAEEISSIIGQPIEYRDMLYTVLDWKIVPPESTYFEEGTMKEISSGIYFVYEIDKGHDLDMDIASTVLVAYSYSQGDLVGLADLATKALPRMPYEATKVVFPDYNITRLDNLSTDNLYGNKGISKLYVTGGFSLDDWETPFVISGRGTDSIYKDILDIKNPDNIYLSN